AHRLHRAVQRVEAVLDRLYRLPGGGRRRPVLLLGGVDLPVQGGPQILVADLIGGPAGLLERQRGGLVGGGLGGGEASGGGNGRTGGARAGGAGPAGNRPGAGLVGGGERLLGLFEPALGLRGVHHRQDVAGRDLVAGLDPQLRQRAVRDRGQRGGGGRQHGRRRVHHLYHVAATDLVEDCVTGLVTAGHSGEAQYDSDPRRAPHQSAPHQVMLLGRSWTRGGERELWRRLCRPRADWHRPRTMAAVGRSNPGGGVPCP